MLKKIPWQSFPFFCINYFNKIKLYFINLHYRSIASIHREAKILQSCKILNCRQEKLAVSVGARTYLRGELMTFAHGGLIDVGEDCYIGENSHIWSAEKITIGNRVLISHNVNVHDTDGHPLDKLMRYQHFQDIVTSGHPKSIQIPSASIHIGDDVWIGFNVIILKGVCIGEGAIIGAGSVVTRDVSPWTIFAGNPAKMIREIPESER